MFGQGNRELKKMDDRKRDLRVVEALLFASKGPLSELQLAEYLESGADLPVIIETLCAEYRDRGVNLIQIGGGWAFRTSADLSNVLHREADVERKLSRAAIETLSIIAYHQPVTRIEIEQIRGVSVSKGTLDILFSAGWVMPRGRRNTPGRPATWVTTDGFLNHFGLARIDELPNIDELRAAGLLDREVAPLLSMENTSNTDELALPDEEAFVEPEPE
jgi:segregation and condensation protein B